MSRFAEVAGSWRVAVRVARRSAYRSKARTLLILLMLTLPVFGGTALAMGYTSTFASAETEAAWTLGQADYKIEGIEPGKVIATLPAGSRTSLITHGRTVVRVGDSYSLHDYQAADVNDPVLRGMYAVRAGRAPQGRTEIAVSAGIAETAGIRVGDRLAAGMPLREHTVVGIVDVARELSRQVIVAPGDQPLSDGGPHTLVKLPPGADWTPAVLTGSSRCHIDPATGGEACVSSFGSMWRGDVRPGVAEQATRTAAFVLVVGFAGTQVALLAGAAFAVGARRQRRELAMLGAVGAGPAQVARMVLANGLVLGALAGLCGVASGMLIYWLNRDQVERIADRPVSGGAPTPWLVAIALFAVAVGLLAALGPARGAARRTLRAAISGREPSSGTNNMVWLVGGVLLAAAGAAAAVGAAGSTGDIVTVTVGTVAVLLGITALAPVLVSLVGTLSARLPLAVRLAARHAARHRLRTAASVAAVCTAVAGSTALMLYNAAESVESMGIQPNAPIGQVLIPAPVAARLTPQRLDEIERALPSRAVVPVRVVREPADVVVDGLPEYENTGQPPFPSTTVAVGGADLIRAMTGAEAPRAASAVLDSGGAVAFHPALAPGGSVVLERDIRLPATVVTAPDVYTDVPGVVISERTAAEHRLTVLDGDIMIDTVRAPTPAALAAVNSIMIAVQLEAGATAAADLAEVVVGAKPDPHRKFGPMFLVLAVISGLVTLAASAVAVGLATSEMRNDLSTLAAVGAGPRLRRRLAAAQAGLIVGLGALLGVAAGIAPAAGMVAFRGDLSWQVPWLPLTLTVLVAPALAVLLTTVFTRPQLTLVRRLG